MDEPAVLRQRSGRVVQVAGPVIRGLAGVVGFVAALFLSGALDPRVTTNRVVQTANLSPSTRLALLALACVAALLIHVPRAFGVAAARAIWLATLALGVNALLYARFYDPDARLAQLALAGLVVAIALSAVVDRAPSAPPADTSPRRLSLLVTVSLASAIVLGVVARTSPSAALGSPPAITAVGLVVGAIGLHRRQVWGAAVVQTVCVTLVALMVTRAIPIADDFEGLVITAAIVTAASSLAAYLREAVDAAGALHPRVRRLVLAGVLLALGGGITAFGILDQGEEPRLVMETPERFPYRKQGGQQPPPPMQWQPGNMMNPPHVYEGPDGPKTLPLDRAFILNVWLQGCPDCMPSFDAWRKLYEGGDIPRSVPIVNVAYGNVEPSWAEAYGLRDTLLIDDGSKLVKPQTISTFTTLVVTGERRIIWRGHPKDPDYLDQLKSALAKLPKE